MEKVTGQRVAALRIPEDLFIVGEPFTRNELGAMATHGLLRESIGGCFVESRFRYDSTARAQIAAFLAGRHFGRTDIFCQQTAAWIHGLLPHVNTVCISSDLYHRPYRPGNGLNFEFVQLPIDDEDVVNRKRVRLSSSLRTVCDVACYDPLPIATSVFNQVQRLGDPFLNLDAVGESLAQLEASAPVARALRLVQSYEARAA
ncbi:hypothetical protein ACX5K5_08690 [Glutamicibacter bergerei]|uniref:AbiEi antitoxin C-terminal domain-containing protein n=2 Tax=Glutamicibacter TaxID=1742989 RepID=A0ABV9MFS3_9MICC|nr:MULTISPECIES: hypothetical protein [Glutamicibacter]PCC31290.1 hypothetical protein CIK74_17915 [Glutamicibacter sp. BW77]GGJ65496.1 hypothetical protein GCM10007173_25470 [Glutamicibacter ardleyensis]